MAARRVKIYWVDFGTPRGSEKASKRPVLLIQNDIGNEGYPTTIVAGITSKMK
jgi:mRNA-degrading endonuclease toxin of MazEF toxin-antitoxin module